MKKLLIFAALALAPLFADAQEQKEVVKFLGIPVDGTKAEMVQKLKEKGFRRDLNSDDTLWGEFNGSDVQVTIQTNKGIVSRIIVTDNFSSNETEIKIRFNRLCSQFENNTKYIPASDTAQTIPDKENIAHEILVHKKRYDAYFFQVPESIDIRESGSVKDGDNIKNYISMLEEQKEKGNANTVILLSKFILATTNNTVWFMIYEFAGKYRIALYYENRYNTANGEDL